MAYVENGLHQALSHIDLALKGVKQAVDQLKRYDAKTDELETIYETLSSTKSSLRQIKAKYEGQSQKEK